MLLKCVFIVSSCIKFFFFLHLQFAAVLDGVLSKLSRYDEGTFFSSILSFTVSVFSFLQISKQTKKWKEYIRHGKKKLNIVYSYPLLKVKAAAKYVDVPVSVTQLRTLWWFMSA